MQRETHFPSVSKGTTSSPTLPRLGSLPFVRVGSTVVSPSSSSSSPTLTRSEVVSPNLYRPPANVRLLSTVDLESNEGGLL